MPHPQEIPRRLIQTAPTRDLSPAARAVAAGLRLHHPDWENLFFDDADIARFVAAEFPDQGPVLRSFPHPVQRADFFRYLAVFRLGGFYVDLDVLLEAPLDDLRPLGAFFPFEELTLNRHLRDAHGIDWEIGNYAFGATAGHPFLDALIGNCARAARNPAWNAQMYRGMPRWVRPAFEVLNTTGPGMLTRTLAEHPDISTSVTVLEPAPGCDVCDPANWHRVGRHGVHLMAGSWRPRTTPILGRARRLWESRQRRRLLARSRALGPVRRFRRSPQT
jgi:hypothetical protein